LRQELLHGIEGVPPGRDVPFSRRAQGYLAAAVAGQTLVHPDIFTGKSAARAPTDRWNGRWRGARMPTASCPPTANIPTADGGTHESGFRTALLRALEGTMASASTRASARRVDERRRQAGASAMLSRVHPRAEVGQTKGRSRPRAARM